MVGVKQSMTEHPLCYKVGKQMCVIVNLGFSQLALNIRQGKARQVYLYSTFQHKAIQSALQKWKTLRKWHLKSVIKKKR